MAAVALEERLREELVSSAESIQLNMNAALSRVVATAQRRQRARRVTVGAVAAALVVAAAFGIAQGNLDSLGHSPTPAARSTRPIQSLGSFDVHAAMRNPLTGTWQTAGYTIKRVHSEITAGDLTDADANHVIGTYHRWRAQANFSGSGSGPVVSFETWGPTDPGASFRANDKYSYQVLSHHRLLLSPLASEVRWVFSYRVTDDQLLLHLVSASPQPPNRHTAAQLTAWTFAPFIRVG